MALPEDTPMADEETLPEGFEGFPGLPAPPLKPQGGRSLLRPRRAAKRLPEWTFLIVWGLLAVSLLALWGWLYVVVLSGVQEGRVQHQLLAKFREEVVEGTIPVGSHIPQGEPVATIRIPRLHVRDLVVVEGTASSDLESGPGHRRDSPLPGEAGTAFVLGRSATFGAPFGQIAHLKAGDAIDVTTGEGSFTFIVDTLRRPGAPLTAFDPGAARLTLATSEATVGGVRQVLYVDATLKGSPLTSTDGPLHSLPAAEQQMSGDPGAWLTIVTWLEGLVVAVIAFAWLRVRWGLLPTVLVGAPVLVAALWGVAGASVQLLPNLF